MGHIIEIPSFLYEGKPLFIASNSLFETACVTCVAVPLVVHGVIHRGFP